MKRAGGSQDEGSQEEGHEEIRRKSREGRPAGKIFKVEIFSSISKFG